MLVVASPALCKELFVNLHDLWDDITISINSEASNLSRVLKQPVLTHTSAHQTPVCLCALCHTSRLLVPREGESLLPNNK